MRTKRLISFFMTALLVLGSVLGLVEPMKVKADANEDIVNNWRATSIGTMALFKGSSFISLSDYLKKGNSVEGDLGNLNFIPVLLTGSSSTRIAPIIDSSGNEVTIENIYNVAGLTDVSKRFVIPKDLYIDVNGTKKLVFTNHVSDTTEIDGYTRAYLEKILAHYLENKIIDKDYKLYIDIYGNIIAVKSTEEKSKSQQFRDFFKSYNGTGEVPFAVIFPAYLNFLMYKNMKAPGIEPFILASLMKDIEFKVENSAGKFAKIVDGKIAKDGKIPYGIMTPKGDGYIDTLYLSKIAAADNKVGPLRSIKFSPNASNQAGSSKELNQEELNKYYKVAIGGYFSGYNLDYDFIKEKQFAVGENRYTVSIGLTDKDTLAGIDKFKKDGIYHAFALGDGNAFAFSILGFKIEAREGTNSELKVNTFFSKNSYCLPDKTIDSYKDVMKVTIYALSNQLLQDNVYGANGTLAINENLLKDIRTYIYNNSNVKDIDGLLVSLEQLSQANLDKSLNPSARLDDFLLTVMTFGTSFIFEKTLTALVSGITYAAFRNSIGISSILFIPNLQELPFSSFVFNWALRLTVMFIVIYSLYIVILVLQGRASIKGYLTNLVVTILLLIVPFFVLPFLSVKLMNGVSYILLNKDLSSMTMLKTDLAAKNPQANQSTTEILSKIVAHMEDKNVIRSGPNIMVRNYAGSRTNEDLNKTNQYVQVDDFIKEALATSSMKVAGGTVVLEDKAHYVLYQKLYTELSSKVQKIVDAKDSKKSNEIIFDLLQTNGATRRYLIQKDTALSPDPFGIFYVLANNSDVAGVYLTSYGLDIKNSKARNYVSLSRIYEVVTNLKDKTEYKNDKYYKDQRKLKYKDLSSREKELFEKLLVLNEDVYDKALYYAGASGFISDETITKYITLEALMKFNSEFSGTYSFYPVKYSVDKIDTDFILKLALVSQKDFLTGKIWDTGMFYGDIVSYLLRYNGFVAVLFFAVFIIGFILYSYSKFALLILILIEFALGIQTYFLVIKSDDATKDSVVKAGKQLGIVFTLHATVLIIIKLMIMAVNYWDTTFIKIIFMAILAFITLAAFKYLQLPMLKETLSNIRAMGKTLMATLGSATFGAISTMSGAVNLFNSDNLKEAQLKADAMKDYFDSKNQMYLEELKRRAEKGLIDDEDIFATDKDIKKKIDETLKEKLKEDMASIETEIDASKQAKAEKNLERMVNAINKVSGTVEKAKKFIYGDSYEEKKGLELGNTSFISKALEGLAAASDIAQLDKSRFNSTSFILRNLKEGLMLGDFDKFTEKVKENNEIKDIAPVGVGLESNISQDDIITEDVTYGTSLTGVLSGEYVELGNIKANVDDLLEFSDKFIVEEIFGEDGSTSKIVKFKGTKKDLNNVLKKYEQHMLNKIILEKMQSTRDYSSKSLDNIIHLNDENREIYSQVISELGLNATIEDDYIQLEDANDARLVKQEVKERLNIQAVDSLDKKEKKQLLAKIIHNKAIDEGLTEQDIYKYNNLVDNTPVFNTNETMTKLVKAVAKEGTDFIVKGDTLIAGNSTVSKIMKLKDDIIYQGEDNIVIKTDDMNLMRDVLRYYDQDKDYVINSDDNTIKILNKGLMTAITGVGIAGTIKNNLDNIAVMSAFSAIANARGLGKAFKVFSSAQDIAKDLASSIIVNRNSVEHLLGNYTDKSDYIINDDEVVIINPELQDKVLSLENLDIGSRYVKSSELIQLDISDADLNKIKQEIPIIVDNNKVYIDSSDLGYAVVKLNRHLGTLDASMYNSNLLSNYTEGVDFVLHEGKIAILSKELQNEIELTGISYDKLETEPINISKSHVLKDVVTGKQFIYDYTNFDDYMKFINNNSSVLDLDITAREITLQNEILLDEFISYTKGKYREGIDFAIDRKNNKLLFNSALDFASYIDFLNGAKNNFTPITTSFIRPVFAEFVAKGLIDGIDYMLDNKNNELIVISNRAKDLMQNVYNEQIELDKKNVKKKLDIINSVAKDATETKGELRRALNISINDINIVGDVARILQEKMISNVESIDYSDNLIHVYLYDNSKLKETTEEILNELTNIGLVVDVLGVNKPVKYYVKFSLTAGKELKLIKSYKEFDDFEQKDIHEISSRLHYKVENGKYVIRDFIYNNYIYIRLDELDLSQAIYKEDL